MMNTKRQQRLARAIEGLSGRDLESFRKFMTRDLLDSQKLGFQMRLLEWSQDTLASTKQVTPITEFMKSAGKSV